jgi:hypothetical protein
MNHGEQWTCTEALAMWNMFSLATWNELVSSRIAILVHQSPLIDVQGDSFSFQGRIPVSGEGHLSLVFVLVYDAEFGAFDPAWECSISDSFGIFLFWIRSKMQPWEGVAKSELWIKRALTHQRCQFSVLVGSKQGPSTWHNMQQFVSSVTTSILHFC